MKVYFNGFWSGFHDGTNAVNVKFFLNLLNSVYDTCVETTFNLQEAEILVENTQINTSLRDSKKWLHTYLFSGESYLHRDADKYSCVLYGNRNHKNIVNTPLYIPYYVSSFDESLIVKNIVNSVTSVPENDVLVIVSNSGGEVRNKFITELESNFRVTFAGNYKNNIGGTLPHYYNTKEFRDYVGTFKFVLAMENSEEDTYITEKITHGLMAGSIPIYWGSKRVKDYFNSDRFLEVKDHSSFGTVIQRMKTMTDQEWLSTVNRSPFTTFGQSYTVNQISKHIKNLIFTKPFPTLTSLYMICNKEFEPTRFAQLNSMMDSLQMKDYNYNYICPTYKHTISNEDMARYVTDNSIVQRARRAPIRKSEISLFLNFISVWDHIVKSYKDGTFLILEADAFALPEISRFNSCLNKLVNKNWSGINISSDGGAKFSFKKCDSFIASGLLHRPPLSNEHKTLLETNCIEDLSSPIDKDVRFFRKYHTRCTDSQLWSYEGCCQMLELLTRDYVFNIPLDYYITNILETNINVKYYWTDETYFDQASNRGYEVSAIQNDMT